MDNLGSKHAENRILNEILHEQAGVWFFHDEEVSVIILKTTSDSIKHLIQGCNILFLFGKDGRYPRPIFHAGIKIFDDPINYLTIISPLRFKDEHASLESILKADYSYLSLYNELNSCVATAKLSFDRSDKSRILNMCGDLENLHTGEYTAEVANSMDCFEYSIGLDKEYRNVDAIPVISVKPVIAEWKVMKNHFVGFNDGQRIQIDDPEEGIAFEKQVWVALSNLFQKRIYHSPEVYHNNKKRELTDLLAFYDGGYFLIEAKSLTILGQSKERTMDRKVLSLQKHILKAIKQLVGAVKNVEAGNAIYDQSGNIISLVENDRPPNCIVLVPELLPFGDNWISIQKKMLQAMVSNRLYLNVIDFKEFMRYVGFARGSRDKLNLMLIERIETFVKHETIFIKVEEEWQGK